MSALAAGSWRVDGATGPVTFALPELAGSRAAADRMVAPALHLVPGRRVVLDGTHLASGPQSFADQLVFVLLVNAEARGLQLADVPEHFAGYVREAMERRGLRGKLVL